MDVADHQETLNSFAIMRTHRISQCGNLGSHHRSRHTEDDSEQKAERNGKQEPQ